LYKLLAGALAALDAGLEPAFVELYFKLHLLEQLGHKPDLGRLIKPHGPNIYLDLESGLVNNKGGEKLKLDELKLMRLLYDFPLNQVAKVKGIGPASSRLLEVIDRFYSQQFSQRFKSSEI
jgi:hypothetical protein